MWKRLALAFRRRDPSREELQQHTTSSHQDEDEEVGFQRLPLELICHTMHYLPPESCASLSLINKQCYQRLQPLTPLPDLTAKRQFLRLLERDSPHMLLCACCDILYDWTKSPPWSTFMCPRDFDRPHQCAPSLCDAHFEMAIYRQVLDLVLRHHEFGPEYGLPLSHLEHTCNGPESDPAMLVKIVPRIIGKQLFMWRSVELLVNVQGEEPIRPQLLKLRNITCYHANTCPVALCAVSHVLRGGNQSEMRCAQLMKCAVCATDLQVTAAYAADLVRVRVDIWQNFGSRESSADEVHKGLFDPGTPFNAARALMRDIRKDFSLRKCSLPDAPVGSLIHQWTWFACTDRIDVGAVPNGEADGLPI